MQLFTPNQGLQKEVQKDHRFNHILWTYNNAMSATYQHLNSDLHFQSLLHAGYYLHDSWT